jgi:hypothetical protein
VALVLLEFVVRVFFPIFDPSGYVEFGHLPDGTPIGPFGRVLRQVKNTGDYDVEVRFNAWGFRDDKSLTSATDADLFVVGDSFAFGWGVEARDRFSDQLQTILYRPVFNIAIAGTDFDGYDRLIRYAQASGAIVNKVIICVTMENDLHIYDVSRSPGRSASASTTDLLPMSLWSLKAHIAEHSALFVMMTHAAHKTPGLRQFAVRLGLIRPNLEGIGDVLGDADAALVSSAHRLLYLVSGRDAIVLIIPSRRLWVGESRQRAEAARLHTKFVNILRNSGLTVADMRERLESTGNPLSYHFANDGHWNKEGHRLAAEFLAGVLQAKGY